VNSDVDVYIIKPKITGKHSEKIPENVQNNNLPCSGILGFPGACFLLTS